MGERRNPLSEKSGWPREFGEAPHTRSGARRAPKDRSFTNFGRGGGILYPTNIIKNRIEIYLIEVWKKFLCDKKKLEKVGCVLIVRGDFFLILQHYLKALL